jgi:Mn2+/Fe2+ NRAMP family transporter
MPRRSLLTRIGPGLLVAATGVGAGDLATGAFSGQHLGLAVLWAVVLGAVLKAVMTEGVARFQLATGDTLLDGGLRRAHPALRWAFLIYFLPWSWATGAAMVSACGLSANALVPLTDDPERGRLIWAVVHSAVGALIAWRGGFRCFEVLMAAAIGVMFVCVVGTAIAIGPDWSDVLSGLLIPRIPSAEGEGIVWTIALLGGVGGTLTVLCYGYWIRESGREKLEDLAESKLDLTVGYAVTAVFGLAMVVIGSAITVDAKGTKLILNLSAALEGELGPVAAKLFLLGAWAAIFSSLLGVWQAVPLLFADWWRATRSAPVARASIREPAAIGFLVALAVLPLFAGLDDFKAIQRAYAVIGALFMPLLALVLLRLNSKRRLGELAGNRWPARVVLIFTAAFFLLAGWLKVQQSLGS